MKLPKPLWVRMELGMDDDPMVQRLADLTGLDEFGVLGRLYKLRDIMFRRGDASDIVPYAAARLDRLLAQDGFTAALLDVGVLEEQDHGILTMPGFWGEYSMEGNRKALDARRKANERQDTDEEEAAPEDAPIYNKRGNGAPTPRKANRADKSRTNSGQKSDKSRTKIKIKSCMSPPTPSSTAAPPPGTPPAPLFSGSSSCASGGSESPPVSGSASVACSGPGSSEAHASPPLGSSASATGSASDRAVLSAPSASEEEPLKRFVEAVRTCRPEWRGKPGQPLAGLKAHELALAREAAADCGEMFVDRAEVVARFMAATTERSSSGEVYFRPRWLHRMFSDARVVLGHAELWERERKRRLR